MIYNICIAIPVKSISLSEIKPTLDKIEKKKTNFIEFRFDYINNVQSLTLDSVIELLNIINNNMTFESILGSLIICKTTFYLQRKTNIMM